MAYQNLITCFVCEIRLLPRQMRRIDGVQNEVKRNIAILRRDMLGHPALDLINETKIFFNCDRYINEEIELTERDPACMRMNVLSQTRSASCLICNQDENVHRLSLKARVNIFVTSNIVIPSNVRSCQEHLNDKGFLIRQLHAGLRFINRPYNIRGEELQEFIQHLRRNILDATKCEDEESFEEEEFRTLTSLTKAQFNELFLLCDPVVVPAQVPEHENDENDENPDPEQVREDTYLYVKKKI